MLRSDGNVPKATDNALKKEGNKTLAGAAYEKIKADVIGGTLEPGQRLRIEDLRQAYGTGASPLREALRDVGAALDWNHRDGIIRSPSATYVKSAPVSASLGIS